MKMPGNAAALEVRVLLWYHSSDMPLLASILKEA